MAASVIMQSERSGLNAMVCTQSGKVLSSGHSHHPKAAYPTCQTVLTPFLTTATRAMMPTAARVAWPKARGDEARTLHMTVGIRTP